ncbi:MAG: ferritin family protein [Clostridia bacterium]|nr:ferritin family protein [Clostridia bacterium]
MDKIQAILNFAMRMEKDAGDFYSYYLDKVKSDSTKELFASLVEMEKQHYGILKEKFDEMGFEHPPITVSWVVDDQFKSKDPHILADNSDLLGSGKNELSDLSIIRMAYLIENDFAEFYKNAVDAVEDANVKKLLSELSEWENSHRDLFYKKYQSLLKEYYSDIASIIFGE